MRKITLSTKKDQTYYYKRYSEPETDCSGKNKMSKFIKKIKSKNLTEKQKTCLKLYFDEKLNTVQIAKKLNVNPSTVWRHIQKAKLEIEKIVKYYYLKQ